MGGINSNVVLMLHGDGANGGSVFIDSARGHLVTKRNSVAIYASTAKLGTGGFFFSFNSLNEQTISIAHSIDFCFPTDDFTWDLYVWASGVSSMGMPILVKKLRGAYDGYALTVNPGHGRLVVNFAHQTGNSYGSWLYSLAAPTSFAISCWNHIAVTRAGSVIRMFSNGSIVVSQTGISTLHSGTDWVRIGQQNSNAYAWGRMDEIRLVKGVAVWTEDFVPPTEQYTWDMPVTNISLTVPNVQPKIAVPVGFTLANGLKRDIALKRVNMEVDQIRAALMSAGFLFNPLTHHDLSIANLSVNAIGNSILISVDTTLDNISDLVSIYFSGLSFLASTDNSVEGILLYNTTASYVIGFLSYQTTIPANEIISCKGVYIRVE